MACYHPLKAYRTPTGVVFSELSRHDIIGNLELPCGQCIGCRMRRASDWELRCLHEASLWPANCFVTLTYAPGSLPPDASLVHRDFQLFMKRLRKHFRGRVVRFYMCGEYGPLNLRPHFHACLFNVSFDDLVPAGKSGAGVVFFDSPTLSRLWSFGRVSVQDLTPETASYCARYIMKKVLGPSAKEAYDRVDDDGVVTSRRPEYSAMSLKPGIGAGWFDRYRRDTFPHDFVIASGVKRRPPKYYDKLLKRVDQVEREDVGFAREARGRLTVADSTPERLQVRETVHLARVSKLARNLE